MSSQTHGNLQLVIAIESIATVDIGSGLCVVWVYIYWEAINPPTLSFKVNLHCRFILVTWFANDMEINLGLCAFKIKVTTIQEIPMVDTVIILKIEQLCC